MAKLKWNVAILRAVPVGFILRFPWLNVILCRCGVRALFRKPLFGPAAVRRLIPLVTVRMPIALIGAALRLMRALLTLARTIQLANGCAQSLDLPLVGVFLDFGFFQDLQRLLHLQ